MLFALDGILPLGRRVLAILLPVYGHLSVFLLSSTLLRFVFVLVLLPPYLLKLVAQVLPTILWNVAFLMSSRGRDRLAADADLYRGHTHRLAKEQLDGSYEFREADLNRDGNCWLDCIRWPSKGGEFTVCGATARFTHLTATDNLGLNRHEKKRLPPIVLLHGNPSWSFMWRNLIGPLYDEGHEVYALDWLGHGRSDKIAVPELCNFELHMRTLMEFFNFTEVKDAIIVAHDWGGCIALCTLPWLPYSTCTALFLLNTFLPPRISEMSLHCALLYAIWFLTGGILGRYIPELAVMYIMSPRLSLSDAEGYGAPYRGMPIAAKSSVYRFGHIVPGTPRTLLQNFRNTRFWKVFEGLCGPENFDNLNAQSRLAEMDDKVRDFWTRAEAKRRIKTVVAFGDKDPLLIDYKGILLQTINTRHMVDWAKKGVWLYGGGHYPVEEQAERIVSLVLHLGQS